MQEVQMQLTLTPAETAGNNCIEDALRLRMKTQAETYKLGKNLAQ
jgi:hypothetical protein